jgi:hypothetical protein
MAGMTIATRGIADRVLGAVGVSETSKLRSDRVWAAILAVVTVLADFITKDTVDLGSLWASIQSLIGDNGTMGAVIGMLGAFGVGRSNSSAREF